MRPIATLVHDDPYLRMTPEARLAAFKERKARLFPVPPVIEATPAPLAIEPKKKIVAVETEEDRFRKWFEKWKAMRHAPAEPETKGPDVKAIQRTCCAAYGITMADILSARRTRDVVKPRQIAMYLAKTMTLKSLPDVGRRFGGRDHTTVLFAVRKIERMVKTDPDFASHIETLKQSISV